MTIRTIFPFAVIIILATATSCYQTTRISSVPAQEAIPAASGIYYSLPFTTFVIRVETEQTLFIPGPYAAYAEKYLGIKDARTDFLENWKITNVQFETAVTSDPSQWYFLKWNTRCPLPALYRQIAEQGMILDSPGKNNITAFHPKASGDIALLQPVFSDVSYTDYFVEKTDTLYKTIFQDSVFVKMPVFRKHVQQKNLEEKASEAAHLIHKLRKRRFKIAAADYNVLPQGEAMKAAFDELNRTEEMYLSLFTGKTISRKYVKTFLYTPSKDQPLEIVLARFSSASGWAEEKADDALPLRIVMVPSERNLPGTVSEKEKKKKDGENTIYYRLPLPSEIRLFLGPDLIFQTGTSVYQMGTLTGAKVHQNIFCR